VKRCWVVTAVFLTLALGWPAWAGQGKLEPYSLGEVVVKAGKTPADEPALASSLDEDQLRAYHPLSVADALQFIPGVMVTRGRKDEPEIAFHGFSQQEMLVLVDGVPYYETNYGKLNLDQLPSGIISRLEVIKSPASVLYGANALGGVINIVTKAPGPKPVTSLSAELGRDGAWRTQFNHGARAGHLMWWVAASAFHRDGWELSSDFSPVQGVIIRRPGGSSTTVLEDGGERDNSDRRHRSLWTRVGWSPGPQAEAWLSAYWMKGSWGMPPNLYEERVYPNPPAFSRLGRIGKYLDWGVDLSGRREFSNSCKLVAKLFYHRHEDDYCSYADLGWSQLLAVSTYEDKAIGGMLQLESPGLGGGVLKMAAHVRRDEHSERDDTYLPFAPSRSWTTSLGVEHSWGLGKGVEVRAGMGWNRFWVSEATRNETARDGSFIGQSSLPTPSAVDTFDFGLNLAVPAGQGEFFAAVGRTSRFPTLEQLFSSRSGNIELSPERSWNLAVGIKGRAAKGLSGRIALFGHDITDRISRDGPYPDSRYRNYSHVRTWGVEIEARWQPAKDLLLSAAYSWTQAEDMSDGRVTEQVTDVPEHRFLVSLRWVAPRVKTRVALTLNALSRRYNLLPTPADPTLEVQEAGGYALVDLKISQPIGKMWELWGFVGNLLDTDYQMEYGYPGPGRSWWIGIRASF